MIEERKTGRIWRIVTIVGIVAALLIVLGWQLLSEPGTGAKPLKITRVEKTSTTLYYHSYQDFALSWTIKVTIQNDGDDVEAGRVRLVVSLYDSNGRYDTKQIDDLGPLTSGWDADFSVNFLINQEYRGEGKYAEVTLYLDGKQVDKAVTHY